MAPRKKNGTTATQQKETAAPSGDWFQTGRQGIETKKQKDTIAAIKKEKSVNRFRIKANEEATIVFVDDTGFYCHVHQLQIGGSWNNFITCVKDFSPCPVCNRGGNKPTYTAHYTIIDTRTYTKNNGEQVKNQKVIFPAKGATINKIADLKTKHGSLVGRAFSVKRYTDSEPNCGSTFDLIGKVDLVKKFGEDATVPIDYLKVLAPPTEEELASLGFGDSITGSSDDVGDADDLLNDL